jgi:galactofuranosylgalactofuranosylrhamnosyl-N-acetylglucosaminyl-diphospho-decaprenol beta-1,5/1,6-galactofuranosyltransferase
MNGIVCLGEDFSTKQGPMTAYLDARYHMVLGLLSADGGAGPIVWVGCRLFTKAMTSYLYGSAHAVTLAVRDVLAGPAFFRDNIDLASVRAEIMVIAADEKLLPIQRSTMKVQPPQMQRESRWRRLGRVLTLHGFLLPDLLIRNRTTVQAKAFHGKASAVFRYRRVLYEHAQSGQGFIAEFNRKRFFAELRDFLKVWLLLLVRLPRLRDTYRAGSIELGSEAFWRDVYADVLQPRGMPVDAVARKADNCSTQITAHDEHPYVRTPVS